MAAALVVVNVNDEDCNRIKNRVSLIQPQQIRKRSDSQKEEDHKINGYRKEL